MKASETGRKGTVLTVPPKALDTNHSFGTYNGTVKTVPFRPLHRSS
jgi:hypothetical protein